MVLLDKIDDIARRGIHFELGGSAARSELTRAIGVHATCYEGVTKLLALKACGAYWNEKYYDPQRRTLTKPLMYTSGELLLIYICNFHVLNHFLLIYIKTR